MKKTGKFLFAFVAIAFIVVVQLIMLFNGYRSIEPDILMINEVASIRGYIQRYSKLVVVGFRDQQMETKIDKLLELSVIQTERMSKKVKSEDFVCTSEMQEEWQQLKELAKKSVASENEIEKQNLKVDVISLSEELWKMGDKIVLQSQSVSQNKIYYFRSIALAILLTILVLFAVVVMFKGILNSLEENSTYDMLTHAFNRRYFDFVLRQEISRANRKKGEFSIILMDIDFFKSINDTHGHSTGDRVLQEMSSLIMQTIRKADVFSRVGGEEFVCILPDTSSESAFLTAERIRKLIESHSSGDLPKVTMSFGVTEYRLEESAEELMNRADLALYEAKAQGRNRTVLQV